MRCIGWIDIVTTSVDCRDNVSLFLVSVWLHVLFQTLYPLYNLLHSYQFHYVTFRTLSESSMSCRDSRTRIVEQPPKGYQCQVKSLVRCCFKSSTRGLKISLKGWMSTVMPSLKFIVSIGAEGSSEILNDHNKSAVLMKTELNDTPELSLLIRFLQADHEEHLPISNRLAWTCTKYTASCGQLSIPHEWMHATGTLTAVRSRIRTF